MEQMKDIAAFKAINEDIKAILGELDKHISDYPYFDYRDVSKNNKAFVELLDKLLEARCTIEELKKYHF
ncbi:hypothetical protein [Sulfuricurvum sp.]|uniref:hypothetical protein n=1 Tax=Sulfuricurvum sp. TaxID=2025608 RepID=UPI0035694003